MHPIPFSWSGCPPTVMPTVNCQLQANYMPIANCYEGEDTYSKPVKPLQSLWFGNVASKWQLLTLQLCHAWCATLNTSVLLLHLCASPTQADTVVQIVGAENNRRQLLDPQHTSRAFTHRSLGLCYTLMSRPPNLCLMCAAGLQEWQATVTTAGTAHLYAPANLPPILGSIVVLTLYSFAPYRCSEQQVAAAATTSPAHPLSTSPSHSRLPSGPADMTPASMATVRRALDAALLQDNNDFWDKNPMTKAVQDVGRRNQQAMQVYLRLFLLAASNGESVLQSHSQACTA